MGIWKGMPFNIISYKKSIWKGIEGHLKGIVQKLEDSQTMCPSCSDLTLKKIFGGRRGEKVFFYQGVLFPIDTRILYKSHSQCLLPPALGADIPPMSPQAPHQW